MCPCMRSACNNIELQSVLRSRMCHLHASFLQVLSSGSGCYQHAKPASPSDEVRGVVHAFCTQVAFPCIPLSVSDCFLQKKECMNQTCIKPGKKIKKVHVLAQATSVRVWVVLEGPWRTSCFEAHEQGQRTSSYADHVTH